MPAYRSSLARLLVRSAASSRRALWDGLVTELPAWVAYKFYDMLFCVVVICVLRRFKWTNRLCNFFNWEAPPR